MPTSRSPFGVNIAPLPFPDFQTDINKQLSFWNTMQQMQRRAAGITGGGGRVPRNENGLTPWQQLQADEKKAKAEAKAAEAEAKKNVMLGLDPVTKEPIIYRNESGQNLTQKDRDRLLADELQRRLKNAAGQDVELNKALGELNSGTELSTQRRSELQRVIRDRTKALGRSYGIDDRATFDAIIGPSKQVLDEQRQALRNDSFLDTVWAGMRKGGNALYYAATMPWMSDAERLEAAKQMREEQEAITRSSPTLQERALVEAEAAREGKDVGYMQAAQANLASNIGASVADTVTSFAPAIAASMIPGIGTYFGPLAAAGVGAGLNQVSQAARVEADPNLTEAQKQQALSYSDPGFVTTTGIGAATGFLMPGSVGSGAARLAGRGAAALGAKAGSKGVGSRLVAAGERAAERANAPRSLAALSRDVPVNMAENAGLMAANTAGANVAYNMSTGQPLTQGAMEGVGRAAMEGAVVGVPFGIGRTLRRRAAPTVQATTEGTVSSTGKPANTQPVSIFEQAMKADTAAQEWKRDLLKTVVNPRKVKTEAADKLIAEYLDTVDTTVNGWRDEMSARLVSIDDLPRWNKMNDNSAAALRKVVDTWKGALDDGTIAEKIASNYQRPAEGESRLASYMGELERVRAERAAGQGSGNDSKVATNPPADSSDVASGNPVQNNAGSAETPGGGDGGSTAQNGGPAKAPSAASPQAGREGTPAIQQPANAGSPGTGGKSSGNGAGELAPSTVGRDGSTGNAATPSGGEQPGGVVINWGTGTHEINGKQFVTLSDPDGNIYSGPVKAQGKNKTRQWALLKDGKRVKRPKDSPTNQELSQRYNELEAAKSTNPKGEVKESRFLPRQQYSSAGTSRKQIPESFKKIAWTQGTRNLDIGAGAFELGTDYLRSRGVENTPFDPYNRATDVNNAALDTLRNGEKYDTVTVANLLNVVQEPEIRDNIIKQAAHSVKPDGKAYFQVYESDRSGVGRQTKTGGTDDNWQNARTLKSYQPDIERHFGKVESKDGMLIASEPKDPGPVEWQLNRDGDTVREQRGYNASRVDFEQFSNKANGSGVGDNVHGWGMYVALEEADPRDLGKRAHTKYKATAEKYRKRFMEDEQARKDFYPRIQWPEGFSLTPKNEGRLERILFSSPKRFGLRTGDTSIKFSNALKETIINEGLIKPRPDSKNFVAFLDDAIYFYEEGFGDSERQQIMNLHKIRQTIDTNKPLDINLVDSAFDIANDILHRRVRLDESRGILTFPDVKDEGVIAALINIQPAINNYRQQIRAYDVIDSIPINSDIPFSKPYKTTNTKLFTVEVPDRDSLLHEQRQYSDQPEKVQKALNQAVKDRRLQHVRSVEYNGKHFADYSDDASGWVSMDGSVKYLPDTPEGHLLSAMYVKRGDKESAMQLLARGAKAGDSIDQQAYKLLQTQQVRADTVSALDFLLTSDYDGHRIYGVISQFVGGDKRASQLLHEYGIEGIYYWGQNDGPCAVVFNDEAIKILTKERRIAEGSAVSPEVIDAYLTTPAERKLAATLNRTDVDSPIFPSLLQQFTDTMLKKFKGIPNRSVLLSSNYADVSKQATGWYDPRSQRIGMNPENIFDRFDTVENALHTMSHEIGHDVLDTRIPRSVRTAISADAYNTGETGIARVAKQAYSDMNRTAQGEEIFVETAARENPFLDPAELGTTPREYAEDIVSLTLDGLGAGSADSAAAAREMVHFLATNAPSDIGNFGDIATTVLTSNKDIVEAFTNPNVQTTGLMQELATDYRNKVQEAGLSGYSVSTMRDYLSAVLDPRTSMDVYARTTKLC